MPGFAHRFAACGLCGLACLSGGLARADDELTAAQKPIHDLSWNIALTSDYRDRGLSQSSLRPALELGADYQHGPSSLYLGVWAANVGWIRDSGATGSLEADLYGGQRGELGAGWSYDAGFFASLYPSNTLARLPGFVNANTLEFSLQLGHGPFTVKYWRAATDLTGFADSRGSDYLEAAVNIALADGLLLTLHAGHQRVSGNTAAGYSDWRIGLTRDFSMAGGIVSGTVAAVGTNASHAVYVAPENGRYLGKNALIATVTRVF
jgi:uncharacterized protein (TIGR02001 family)